MLRYQGVVGYDRWPNSEDELVLGPLTEKWVAKSICDGLRQIQAAGWRARAPQCRWKEARAGLAQQTVPTRHSSRFERWSAQAQHQRQQLRTVPSRGARVLRRPASYFSFTVAASDLRVNVVIRFRYIPFQLHARS